MSSPAPAATSGVRVDPDIDIMGTNVCINIDQYEFNEIDTVATANATALLYALLRFHGTIL